MKYKFRSETADLNDEVRAATPGSYVRLPNGLTHYELGGPQDGQSVVLIHGFSVPYYVWDHTYPALVNAGLHTLRYDLFGRGYSDRPQAKYDGSYFCQQLLNLLDALSIEQAVDLVGLSMGGGITACFAAQYPQRVRKVVFIDPAGLPINTQPAMRLLKIPVVGELIFDLLGDKLLVSGQGDDFHYPERFPDYRSKYPYQLKYKGFKAALLATVRGDVIEGMQSYFEQVGKQGKPVLLVWGREDQTIPFSSIQQLMQLIPDLVFQPIDEAGHIPHYERPDVINPILIDFLNS